MRLKGDTLSNYHNINQNPEYLNSDIPGWKFSRRESEHQQPYFTE